MSDDAIPAAVLAAMLEAAARRWPRLELDPGVLAAFVAARRPPPAEAAGWLAEVETGDLVLACACLRGDTAAIAALDRMTSKIAEEVLARHAGSGLDRAELRHEVLGKLLVGDGAPARLDQYGGRGSLEGFVRVMTLRIAMNAARGYRRLETLDSRVAPAGADALANAAGELDHIRHLYRPAFEAALHDALAALPPKERNLLRLHYIERLPCERLAALYHVHETTAWRWISRATAALRDDIARRVAERTGASPAEVESLLRLVDTHLEGSLRDALSSE